MKRVELKLHDLECSNCAMQIEEALEKVPGVKRAEVNVRKETVAVDAEETVAPNTLTTALDDIGFPATPVA